MNRISISAALLVILLLSGCGLTSEVPQNVIDMAMDKFKSEYCVVVPVHASGEDKWQQECQKITITSATKEDVTSGDKLNGISQKYHVKINCIHRQRIMNPAEEWSKWSELYDDYRIIDKNGSLTLRE
jgi:hypothetical protein